MSLELITMEELLRDPQYRAFFKTVHKLPEHLTRPGSKPWKLRILRHGEKAWRSTRFATYKEAVQAYVKLRKDIQNAAISCPALSFMPPIRNVRVKGKFITVQGGHKRPYIKTLVWQPQIDADMPPHYWCPYCRRPSIFKYAVKHTKTLNAEFSIPSSPALRCVICGASDRMVNVRDSLNEQKWDPNRPKVYNL